MEMFTYFSWWCLAEINYNFSSASITTIVLSGASSGCFQQLPHPKLSCVLDNEGPFPHSVFLSLSARVGSAGVGGARGGGGYCDSEVIQRWAAPAGLSLEATMMFFFQKNVSLSCVRVQIVESIESEPSLLKWWWDRKMKKERGHISLLLLTMLLYFFFGEKNDILSPPELPRHLPPDSLFSGCVGVEKTCTTHQHTAGPPNHASPQERKKKKKKKALIKLTERLARWDKSNR